MMQTAEKGLGKSQGTWQGNLGKLSLWRGKKKELKQDKSFSSGETLER